MKNSLGIILSLSILVLLVTLTGCVSDHDHEHDDDHDHSVEIEGSVVRTLTVQEVADLWEIDSQKLFNRIVEEFNFQGNYTTETVLDDMREEYRFSPAIIKDIAEDIKQRGLQNE